MARTDSESEPRPLTDDEHDEVGEVIRNIQTRTREYLARELGGEPEDYAADFTDADE